MIGRAALAPLATEVCVSELRAFHVASHADRSGERLAAPDAQACAAPVTLRHCAQSEREQYVRARAERAPASLPLGPVGAGGVDLRTALPSMQ